MNNTPNTDMKREWDKIQELDICTVVHKNGGEAILEFVNEDGTTKALVDVCLSETIATARKDERRKTIDLLESELKDVSVPGGLTYYEVKAWNLAIETIIEKLREEE